MFNFFRKKTISDNAKDFETQYKITKIIIFNYLEIWFKQIFSTPEWKEIFADKPNMHTTMSAEVMRFLLALNDDRTLDGLEDREEVILAKKHAVKWADDAMIQDRDFCELVVQTLRMELIFQQYINGSNWPLENPRGKKVHEILMKYGKEVPETPDPKKYEKLINKWMLWDEITKKKLNEKSK